MEVKHEKDTIVWEKFWSGQCDGKPEQKDEIPQFEFTKDFVASTPMTFHGEEYKKLAGALVHDLSKTPDKLKVFLENLERYRSGDRVTG